MKTIIEMAQEALECALSDDKPYIVKSKEAITAIKEVLAQPVMRLTTRDEKIVNPGVYEVPVSCSTHPDAPHGFLRNASHEADQYVCECAYWKPPREWVGLTEDDVNNALYKYHGWREFAAELERLLKEKNYG